MSPSATSRLFPGGHVRASATWRRNDDFFPANRQQILGQRETMPRSVDRRAIGYSEVAARAAWS
jgi:hypothetical protein